MMTRTIFLTGTDTGVGKTHVARLLLEQARAQGIRCAGFKPVAAGGVDTDAGVQNEDALALQKAGSLALPYAAINPYALPEPIAPHIAAEAVGVEIEEDKILAAHAELARQAELVVTEGAGGWHVPLNRRLLFSGLVAQAGWPVVLVVGMRLGCLNHALLSAQAIQANCRLLGWVANCLPPTQPHWEANLRSLEQYLTVPLLGIVPPMGEGAMPTTWPKLTIDRVLGVLG
jgi:dethiobiotin synthetase